MLRDEAEGGGWPGPRPLPFFPTAAGVSHPGASIPAQPLARLPPDAHAVINIYFAVTHTPNSRTDLCQERSKKCLSHSRKASMYLLGGGTAGPTFRLTAYTGRRQTCTPSTQAIITGKQEQCANPSILSHLHAARRGIGAHARGGSPRAYAHSRTPQTGWGGMHRGRREPTVQM